MLVDFFLSWIKNYDGNNLVANFRAQGNAIEKKFHVCSQCTKSFTKLQCLLDHMQHWGLIAAHFLGGNNCPTVLIRSAVVNSFMLYGRPTDHSLACFDIYPSLILFKSLLWLINWHCTCASEINYLCLCLCL